MIKDVNFKKTTYNELPYKFEAGTPNIGDVIGFNEALSFINNIGLDNISLYEKELKNYASNSFNEIEGINIIGNSKNKIGIFSFTMDKIHYYDLGLLLDSKGIAIRTGHHCTQPLMDKFNLEGTFIIIFIISLLINKKVWALGISNDMSLINFDKIL